MIPTMILFGAITGRWWRASIALGAVLWPLLLLLDGVTRDPAALATGALLGAVNIAVGVGLHQGVLRGSRAIRHAPSH